MRAGGRAAGCDSQQIWLGRGSRALALARSVGAVLLLYFAAACANMAHGQTAKHAEAVHSVFVAPMEDTENAARKAGAAAALRQRVIDLLHRSGKLQVTADEASAESVLRLKAVVWPTGTMTLNPRSQAGSFTNYEGYATAYLYAGRGTGGAAPGSHKPGEVLWTYLATPKRFRFDGIVDDLATQIAAALQREAERGAAGSTPGRGSAARGTALEVAGATLPAPLYLKWFESFEEQPNGVPMTYDAVGSVAGMEELRAGKIDLAASDIPAARGGGYEEAAWIPSVAGAIVPIYNLGSGPGPGTNEPLNLTGSVLAAIYAGRVTMWDDPAIAAANRGTRLPHSAIAVVHRSDGSGTTFVWTSFLAQADVDWKARAGATVEWPAGIAVAGNEGMAEEVAGTPNSIGYVELAYAIQHRLRYAAVRNPAGKYVKASLETISAAAGTASNADGLVLNGPGKDAYPIATFTWLVVPRTGSSAEKRASTKAFLRWMLTSGQRECASLGYSPLPKSVAADELRAVASLP